MEIAYNFTTANAAQVPALRNAGEGKTTKRWNDILAHQPDSPTWSKTGGPIEMSWVAGVAAAGGGLRGRHIIGFQDNPGVTPLTGKHIERILRFRIVVKDSTKRHEILATQVITCDGQAVPVSMTHVDSLAPRSARSARRSPGPIG